jgi:mRNA interferase MazF
MGPFAVGQVVLIASPFSDLSRSKLRPALVVAAVGREDWLSAQITSNPYGDTHAVELTDADFASGSLRFTSWLGPGKLFAANQSLLQQPLGKLTPPAHQRVVDAVVRLLRDASSTMAG